MMVTARRLQVRCTGDAGCGITGLGPASEHLGSHSEPAVHQPCRCGWDTEPLWASVSSSVKWKLRLDLCSSNSPQRTALKSRRLCKSCVPESVGATQKRGRIPSPPERRSWCGGWHGATQSYETLGQMSVSHEDQNDATEDTWAYSWTPPAGVRIIWSCWVLISNGGNMLNSWGDFCFQEINTGTIAMDKVDTLFCFHETYFSGEKTDNLTNQNPTNHTANTYSFLDSGKCHGKK